MKNQQRINGFEQQKGFYSWVFNNQDKQINSSHIALYNFLMNQNNRSNWVQWFKVPFDLGMTGSSIGSRNTYYKCLDDMQAWGLLKYKKGINNYKAPLISLTPLKTEQATEQATVPLSEQVSEHHTGPPYIHLTEPLPEHIYKLVTSNLELVTNNLSRWIKEEEKKNIIPTWNEVLEHFKAQKPYREELEYALQAKYDTWVSNGWKDGFNKKISNWKNTVKSAIPHLRPVKIETIVPHQSMPAFKK